MATLLETARKLKPSTPLKPSQSYVIAKVRVVLRVRPFLVREIASKNGEPVSCVSLLDSECDSNEEVVVHLKDQETSRNECYKLDGFFGPEENSVAKIFEKEVRPLIPGVFNGCNLTVFAYGATGSGKTYTMQGTDEQPGLMLQAMSTVLSMCQSTGGTAEISYYEVYMDRCYDLLELKAKEVAVLDDKDGQVHLRGLSKVPVNSMSEFHEVFSSGIQRRKVAHTGLNDISSRSHGALVITVSNPSADGLGATVAGKLNLIDLAGNEDNRRSCNEGIRLLESAKNNQSLLALSNVIYALNSNKPRVPYRESKLTRILQDSLGGTSCALMVACLNPGEYQESLHTVSLAARSRNVYNFVPSAKKQETPKIKVDMEAKLRSWLESKGKTKSMQRLGQFGSPLSTRTPGSFSSFRKETYRLGSAKAKTTNQGAHTKEDWLRSAPRRNLFISEIKFDAHVEDFSLQMEDAKHHLSCTNHSSPIHEEAWLCYNSTAPVSVDSQLQSSEVTSIDETLLESRRCLPDELLCKEKENITTIKAVDPVRSSPNNEKSKAYGSPARRALSPINSNITRIPPKDFSPGDQEFENFSFVVSRDKFQDLGTPLDKFNARSSNFKDCLVEEYIDFLNIATREELLELKGIGPKRADYIVELRETSPIKSLNDLEKMGLSSKQVNIVSLKPHS
ncbi:hypothetical protein Ancab_032046 [Ancistrocladus abbreviatus]